MRSSRPRGKDDVVDLGKVVVFGGQPEDGGVGMACRRGLAGAGQRSGRLEGSKQRSAEEADLLPGHHGSRALAQGCKRRRGGWATGFCAASSRTSSGQCAGSAGALCQPSLERQRGIERPRRRRPAQ